MLYNYQQRIRNDVLSSLDKVKSTLVVMPTGSGKSRTAASVALSYPKVLWAAHRSELLIQAADELSNIKHPSFTVNSLFSTPPQDAYDLLVLDECFPYDTMIDALVNGKPTKISIGNIVCKSIGTHVLSNKNGIVEYKPIISRTNMGRKEIWEITISSNDGIKSLFITENGKIYANGSYLNVSKLQIDMTTKCLTTCCQTYEQNSTCNCIQKAITITGQIVSIKRTGELVETYDIGVADNHNFFANDVLVHNCHHSPASTIQRFLNNANYKKLLGLTATPYRLDKLVLGFDDVIYGTSVEALTNAAYLAPIDLYTIKDSNRNKALIEWYYANHKSAGKTLIFTKDLIDAQFFYNALNGFNAQIITANSDRKNIIYDFKYGNIQILISCLILTEGTDLPCAKTVLIGRRTQSKTLLTQIVGRVMRIHPSKTHGNVVYVIDNSDCSIASIIKPRTHFIVSNNQILNVHKPLEILYGNP